jgi:hypothetical protein
MKKIASGILLVSIFLGSCKKYLKEGDLDKEVIVEFPLVSITGTTGPDFKTLPAYYYIVDFDKRDYPKVDSITFNASMFTNTLSDTSYARLFNITDNVEIANSTVSGSSNNFDDVKQVRTNNIYQSLPDKRITLAIQTKGSLYNAFLKLRRH